jgi:hypothetical protein
MGERREERSSRARAHVPGLGRPAAASRTRLSQHVRQPPTLTPKAPINIRLFVNAGQLQPAPSLHPRPPRVALSCIFSSGRDRKRRSGRCRRLRGGLSPSIDTSFSSSAPPPFPRLGPLDAEKRDRGATCLYMKRTGRAGVALFPCLVPSLWILIIELFLAHQF